MKQAAEFCKFFLNPSQFLLRNIYIAIQRSLPPINQESKFSDLNLFDMLKLISSGQE